MMAESATRFDGLLPPIPENIPEILKSYNQWIVWQTDYDNDAQKWTKIPRQAKYPYRNASKNDPRQFSDFNTAYNAYLNHSFLGGVGFIVTENDPFVFFDLDKCVKPDGIANDEVVSIIDSVYSYTEYSPSNKGIRIIALGKLPGKQINNRSLGFELYDGQKNSFLTVTGQVYLHDQPDIVLAQKEIDVYHGEWKTQSTSETALVKFSPDFQAVGLEGLPLSTISLINGDNWGSYPSRSEVLYGVCGDLIKAGLNDDQILSLLTDDRYAISQVAESRRPNNRNSQRIWIANYTLAKARAEFNDLSSFVFDVDKLKFKDTKESNDLNHEVRPDSFPVPILNSLMEWMETKDDTPTRSITMQGVIAAVSVLAGRIYKSELSNDSSLFLMTLAETGRGKGYPAKAIKQLFQEAGYTNLIKGSGNTSPGAIFTALRESPCHIQISDEIGKQYKSAKSQPNGQLSEAFSQLTIAYSETDSVMIPRNYSGETLNKKQTESLGNRYIVNPSITLFSFATFEQVFNHLSSDEIDDGFLNRQIVINVDDEDYLPERERQITKPPVELVEWVKKMRHYGLDHENNMSLVGYNTAYDHSPTPILVKIPQDVRMIFKAFKNEAKSFNGDKLKLAIRWNENAMRLSTGLAVAENQSDPVISKEIALFSINYIRYHGKRMFRYVDENIADNEFHRLKNQVYSVILAAGKQGRKQSELHRYSRLWKSSNLIARDQALESLKRDELIIEIMSKSLSGRGRKQNLPAYVAIEYVEITD